MTVICALCDPRTKEVWIGCNDGISVGGTRMPNANCIKWSQFGGWAIGLTGSPVTINLLELKREHFPVDETCPLTIVEFLRGLLNDSEVGNRDEDDPVKSYPNTLLLAHHCGRIWDADHFLSIDEVPSGTLWARGAGMEYALGADFPLASKDVSCETRIRNAVEAAIFYDLNCPGRPFVKKLT